MNRTHHIMRPIGSSGRRLLLPANLVAICVIGLLAPQAAPAAPTPTHDQLQQRLGQTIVMVARHDQALLDRQVEQMTRLMRGSTRFQQGQAGRIEESLGLAIIKTAGSIQEEQSALKSRMILIGRELDLLSEDSAAGRQTQLGWAVRTAAQRAPQGGAAFQAALGKEITRLEQVRQRTTIRLQDELRALKRLDADFAQTIPQRYQKAMESTRLTVLMADDSTVVWTDRQLQELSHQVLQQQSSQVYAQLAGLTRAALTAPAGVGGFIEYGLAAMTGAMAVMVWFGLSTRKERAPLPVNPTDEAVSSLRRWSMQGGSGNGGNSHEANILSQLVTFFSWPREIVFGNNVIGTIGRYAERERIKRALVITSRDLHHHGLLEPLKASLSHSGIAFRVYDHVEHDVPDVVIANAGKEYQRMATDLIVAVGGGSVIDTAKAVGILATNGGLIQDYEGLDTIPSPLPHFFAVPTTAGCGSETSQFCVVLDTAHKRKLEIVSRLVIPQMIFIDPTLMVSMPRELTAGSGIDALSNAIEAYCSTWASPLTDTLALDAVRLISESLRTAVADGSNLEARRQMAVAAFEAGLAFNNAQCGAAHALGHPVAGLFNVPERVSEAILLPHVMRYNLETNMARMAQLAVAMGESVEGLTQQEAAEQAISAVQWLLLDIGLPATFDKLGVANDAIPELARQAAQDFFLRTNPRTLTRGEIEQLYHQAFQKFGRDTVHRKTAGVIL
ncbi:MAG: iron-containing alcohol dehydrogenase [Nitrospirae bacterium]|nr:iron-containing alcohol dehydrogenase [Nitrospirota bacterium]